MRKHFLSIADLSSADLLQIIERASARPRGHSTQLAGTNWLFLFEKPSLRTRCSLELAIRHLGGEVLTPSQDEIGLGTREPVDHIARVVRRWFDGIVLRVRRQVLSGFAKTAEQSILINALTEWEHPLQILADLTTVYQLRKKLNLSWCFIGDGNNVCHSLILASALLNIPLTVCTPPDYAPKRELLAQAQQLNPDLSLTETTDPQKGVRGAEVIYTDTWVSMGQEAEAKERRKKFVPYQVNQKLLETASKDPILLHCLPAHPGEEIEEPLLQSESIWLQAENRYYSARALLEWLTRAS